MIVKTEERVCNEGLSVCIPVYERTELVQHAVKSALKDSRVTEVIIMDDGSRESFYVEMSGRLRRLYPDIRIVRQEKNRGPFVAKLMAMEACSNEWAIILDSDNCLDKHYISRLYQLGEWNKRTVYVPEFARPHFDFRKYGGLRITVDVAREMLRGPDARLFTTLLNTGNYLVPVNEYRDCLSAYKNLEIRYADVIAMIYEWLRQGNELYVVSGLHYVHKVHDGSNYKLRSSKRKPSLAYLIREAIRAGGRTSLDSILKRYNTG